MPRPVHLIELPTCCNAQVVGSSRNQVFAGARVSSVSDWLPACRPLGRCTISCKKGRHRRIGSWAVPSRVGATMVTEQKRGDDHSEPGGMKVLRLYADALGESRFESTTMPMALVRGACAGLHSMSHQPANDCCRSHREGSRVVKKE